MLHSTVSGGRSHGCLRTNGRSWGPRESRCVVHAVIPRRQWGNHMCTGQTWLECNDMGISDNSNSEEDENEDGSPWPFDATVFLGDLNYRVDLSRGAMERFMLPQQAKEGSHRTSRTGNAGDEYTDNQAVGETGQFLSVTRVPVDQLHLLQKILRRDQLTKQIQRGLAFVGFEEGPVNFFPTFKYDIGSGLIDSSEKRRAPCWPDRILFTRRWMKPRSQVHYANVDTAHIDKCDIELSDYGSVDVRHSDHRPVVALFRLSYYK